MGDPLLTIDVEAEQRKLSLGRLRSTQQVPVAIARFFAARSAAPLSIQIATGRLSFEQAGGEIEPEAWAALVTLLDRTRDDWTRHRALVELEARGLLDLVVAFCLDAATVELTAGAPPSARLSLRRGSAKPELARADRCQGIKLLVETPRRRWAVAASELEDALRFARFPIEVNGRRIDQGLVLEDAIDPISFQGAGVRGVVGLARAGLAAVTRVLRHGVVDREIWLGPADGTVFEAVLDLEAAVEEPELTGMLRQAVADLYRQVQLDFGTLPPPEQARAKELLLRRADFGGGAGAVQGVRMFRAVLAAPPGPDRKPRPEAVDAAAIAGAAVGKVVRAVGAVARLSRVEVRGPVFILDERDRGFVERHLGLTIREPALLPTAGWGPRRLVLTGWELMRGLLRKTWERAAFRKEIPPVRLRAAENRFLAALEGLLQGCVAGCTGKSHVAFCRGRLGSPVRKSREPGRLCLARGHRRVQAMVAAFERDPATLVAAALLLFGDRELFELDRERVLSFALELTRHG